MLVAVRNLILQGQIQLVRPLIVPVGTEHSQLQDAETIDLGNRQPSRPL